MANTIGGDEVHGDKLELSGDFRGATVNVWAGGPPPAGGAADRSYVFLTYGWGDDRDFVERLRSDLLRAGLAVWRDVENLPSAGNALRLELRQAMDEANRFVPIVGPAAAVSDNVRLEWQYARDRCLPITPVLRLGDESALPTEFRSPLYFDFREGRPGYDYDRQLAALVARLGERPRPTWFPATMRYSCRRPNCCAATARPRRARTRSPCWRSQRIDLSDRCDMLSSRLDRNGTSTNDGSRLVIFCPHVPFC
jgi:hypothetical protein